MNPTALCRRTPGGHQAVLIRYSKIIREQSTRSQGACSLVCGSIRETGPGVGRGGTWAAGPTGACPGNMLGVKGSPGQGSQPGSGLSVSWHVDTLGSGVCPGGTPFLAGQFPLMPTLGVRCPSFCPGSPGSLLGGTLHRCSSALGIVTPLAPISLACPVYSPNFYSIS